jgi:hypothetical protein
MIKEEDGSKKRKYRERERIITSCSTLEVAETFPPFS